MKNKLRLLTVKEASEYLRVPTPTMYHLLKQGKIKCIRIGGRYRISKDYLDTEVLNAEPAANRVLVVEPNPETNAFLGEQMSAASVAMDVTGSAESAWTLLQREKGRYGFILMDLDLPDMPSSEFFFQVTEQFPDLPIVITAAHPDRNDLTKILSVGPATVIKKPFDPKHLDQMVNMYCKRSSKDSARQPVHASEPMLSSSAA